MATGARKGVNKGTAGVKGAARGSHKAAKGSGAKGQSGTNAGMAAKRSSGRQSGY
jgi:hypothetical protein